MPLREKRKHSSMQITQCYYTVNSYEITVSSFTSKLLGLDLGSYSSIRFANYDDDVVVINHLEI